MVLSSPFYQGRNESSVRLRHLSKFTVKKRHRLDCKQSTTVLSAAQVTITVKYTSYMFNLDVKGISYSFLGADMLSSSQLKKLILSKYMENVISKKIPCG